MSKDALDSIVHDVIRNRLVAITEEMRVALQSVSGSPTVTEASDFFTGLFLPDGSVASMGFQVAYQAPVCGAFIRHITDHSKHVVRDGDMYIGNDPYIGALHQNDVQMVGPIFADGEIIAWAGVEAHETDVGGMDFASWSPKAREVFQEGMRIPCVKLIDQGELREDVLEMIVTASRLPGSLGLDIRAFIATLNVARARVTALVERYGVERFRSAIARMIHMTEGRMRARLASLPDGIFCACDFLEHDGHSNKLYRLDVKLEKRGDQLTIDLSGSSKQAPGFINSTRSGLAGAVSGSVLPTLAYDMQWNEGALNPVEIVAPDGLVCTATFPAPVGSATVETIWVTGNAIMLALNKMLAAAPQTSYRAQGVNDGAMATFNLGGVNQFGENFGLHLMDPLAGGSAAFADKDGVNAGGPITSPMSAIADVERNEQVVPLFYLHRKLAIDTGGAGEYRGGLSAEVALTLGGIKSAQALVMTHGAESPNSQGLGGGWPGATIRQMWIADGFHDGRLHKVDRQHFGPKPGLMTMTNQDVFHVIWQGGGGYGDPLERDPQRVSDDVDNGAVSLEAARNIYGVIPYDMPATQRLRDEMRMSRVGVAITAESRFCRNGPLAVLGPSLFVAQDERGLHVVTPAGCILATGHSRWREGAVKATLAKVPHSHLITLHDELRVTVWYCPATGLQLAVDLHRHDEEPLHDIDVDLAKLVEQQKEQKLKSRNYQGGN